MVIFESLIVFAVIIFIIISLYKEIVGPGLTFILAVIVLGLFKVLSPAEILSGFANEQIAVILMLLLLGDIYRQTSVLDIFFDKMFKSAKSIRHFTARVMFVIAPLSAFLNNTPLVALMMPYIHNWSKRNNVSVAKILLPLSFAAILGGCITLIGTSTNLIVNGLLMNQEIIPDHPPLEMFDFVYVGLPMTIIGIVYMLFIGQKLIPDRLSKLEKFPSLKRKYIVEAKIIKKSHLIGLSIIDTGIKNFEGLELFEIIRKNVPIENFSDNFILHENDILLFNSDSDSIADLLSSKPGIVIPSVGMFAKKQYTEVVEIVISHNSTMIGKSVGEENFRAKYDATVLAVHRNGEKLSGKIGNIIVRAGDALLLLAGNNFTTLAKNTHDFYSISKIKEIRRLGFARTAFLIAGTIFTILLSALGVISLFNGLVILITISVLLKIANPKELSKSIDYDLALIIALSLALGTAMMKTGVAKLIAEAIITIFEPLGGIGILSGIYLITTFLAAFITNKAAVALIFPISLTTAVNLDMNPIPFILVVSYAAAANFMTPIGYQTNLMIYGPGGYKFKDFLKVGIPLTFIYMIVTVLILNFVYC